MKASTILVIAVALMVAHSAVAQTGVDGVIGAEWDGYVVSDSADDNGPGMVEMNRWGCRSDGTWLYYFVELGEGEVYSDYVTGNADDNIFPNICLDVDNNQTTYSAYKSTPNITDYRKQMNVAIWDAAHTDHTGIDISLEFGTDEAYYVNWWGTTTRAETPGIGNIRGLQAGGADAVHAYAGSVMEVAVLINDAISTTDLQNALTYPCDNPVPILGNYIVVAADVQGERDASTITYGHDLGVPTVIAIDPNTPLLAGDFNLDGDVDLVDLQILAGNYGTSGLVWWKQGDCSRDGNIDLVDLQLLASSYGQSAGSGGASPVPEPTMIALLGLGLVGFLRRRP